MTTLVTSKALWQSKTMWFNVLAFVAILLESATAADLPFVGSEWFVFAVLVVNALLRLVTSKPVTVTGRDAVEVN